MLLLLIQVESGEHHALAILPWGKSPW